MRSIFIRVLVSMTLQPVLLCWWTAATAQQYVSSVWVADQGDGTYRNPVLNADYSDPDVIRVGDDYYLVSSSFEDVPGLPVLHSKDLVNWTILSHALERQPPFEHFSVPRHGDGAWAPAIRYHDGRFYIYYPDPDFGIYVITSKHAGGPWSAPRMVLAGRGLIDPCPLWDEDGKVYLVHAFAGSRAGIKSVLVINRMNPDGTQVIGNGQLVYDGHDLDPTIEGPKLYKRHGYYYIFAPAGGVSTGWQVVLRSRNIFGPYQRKVVLSQGTTSINGPHQGAWVTTQRGQDWFLHFQDRGVSGRVVLLEPMRWVNDWPLIGSVKGNGPGEPVLVYRKPDVGRAYPVATPAESDEFNASILHLQWQWMANPRPEWFFTDSARGILRLYSARQPDQAHNLWEVPNVLLQKFPAQSFMATTKLVFHPNPKLDREETGLTIMGMSYAVLKLVSRQDATDLVYGVCRRADQGHAELDTLVMKSVPPGDIRLRVRVTDGICQFSYSTGGGEYREAGSFFAAVQGKWTGAKVGIFCTRREQTNDSGYADFDWFRIEKPE